MTTQERSLIVATLAAGYVSNGAGGLYAVEEAEEALEQLGLIPFRNESPSDFSARSKQYKQAK